MPRNLLERILIFLLSNNTWLLWKKLLIYWRDTRGWIMFDWFLLPMWNSNMRKKKKRGTSPSSLTIFVSNWEVISDWACHKIWPTAPGNRQTTLLLISKARETQNWAVCKSKQGLQHRQMSKVRSKNEWVTWGSKEFYSAAWRELFSETWNWTFWR